MSLFIEVRMDLDKCVGTARCGKCAEVCPVNVFETDGKIPRVNTENEDECTLCDLCIQACKPCAVTIHKLY